MSADADEMDARRAGAEAFEQRLRDILEARYHHRHPFHERMYAGELGPEEIRLWVRNRYYYQTRIPIKDGLILTKAEDAGFRRDWIRRIQDHDGDGQRVGGLELWLRLADAVGLEREEVESLRAVLPGVRRACDAYVSFVSEHDLLESVAASLTEILAGPFMAARIVAWEKHYPWVDPEGLHYFRTRTAQAPRDAEEGLAFVRAGARSPEERDRCAAALERKCEILWQLLDAVEWATRRPRLSEHAMQRRDEARDETLLVLPERAIEVNTTGRRILALCDGTRSVDAVASALRQAHPAAEGVEQDVYAFVEDLAGMGALRLDP